MGFLPKIRKSRDFNHDTTPRETKRDQRRPNETEREITRGYGSTGAVPSPICNPSFRV